MWKRLPLIWKIMIGMVLGMVWGIVAHALGWDEFTINWIKPWGVIFLNLLKLVAVPLIFVSLVSGIASLTNITKLSRIGLKTLVLYVLTTLVAISFGLVMVNIVKPGNTFPEEKKLEFQQKFAPNLEEKRMVAEQEQEKSPLHFLVDMVPENIIRAAGDNSKMLQVIFFAIFFGIAMVLLPEEKVSAVKHFFDGLNEIILKIIDIFMGFAPYGVFALLAGLIIDFSGDVALFKALGLYFITVVVGLILLILVFYPTLMKIFVGMSPLKFLRGVLPAQMVAFSTSSSAATLPVTKKQVESELRVHPEISNFVLPIGVTINMDGTSCYQAIAAVFIAEVFGVDLTFGQMLIILLTALLASIGSPGVPGGSIVMLIIVLSSVGLPVEGLALILGVDRPLDMLRTAVNVTGDSTVASLVAKSEGMINNMQPPATGEEGK